MQVHAVDDVVDTLTALGRGAADDAVYLVALLEQKLGEVRTVLAGDAGDEGALGHVSRLQLEGNDARLADRASGAGQPDAIFGV